MNLNDKQITRLRMIGYPIVTEKNQRVSDAIQWFRDEKGIICAVELDIDHKIIDGFLTEVFNGYYGHFITIGREDSLPTVKSHSGAESALLEALIEYKEEKR